MRRAHAIIGGGLVALVLIMPFHAFLSVWLGSLTGHQAVWQSWKELLTIVMVVCGVAIIARSPNARQRLSSPLNLTILGFALASLIVTAITQPNLGGIIYGLKTDLEFLVLFVLAQLVASRELKYSLTTIVLVTGTIVAALALLLVTILPHDLLVHFGYNAKTILPFEAIDPAISAIRTPSTLGGPNQLGSFLILPVCLAVGLMIRRFRWWQPLVIATCLGGIWVSYSRIALIGVVVGLVVAALVALPRRFIWVGGIVAILLLVGGTIGVIGLSHSPSKLQYYILHQSDPNPNNPVLGKEGSTSAHLSAFNQGLKALSTTPLGQGLGTAGPASYHSSKPFIPESYYLQIGIEAGVVGLILFLAVIAQLFVQLLRCRIQSAAPGVIGALVGLSIVNLVLHGWADASTAFVFWIMAGVVVGVAHRDRQDYV